MARIGDDVAFRRVVRDRKRSRADHEVGGRTSSADHAPPRSPTDDFTDFFPELCAAPPQQQRGGAADRSDRGGGAPRLLFHHGARALRLSAGVDSPPTTPPTPSPPSSPGASSSALATALAAAASAPIATTARDDADGQCYGLFNPVPAESSLLRHIRLSAERDARERETYVRPPRPAAGGEGRTPSAAAAAVPPLISNGRPSRPRRPRVRVPQTPRAGRGRARASTASHDASQRSSTVHRAEPLAHPGPVAPPEPHETVQRPVTAIRDEWRVWDAVRVADATDRSLWVHASNLRTASEWTRQLVAGSAAMHWTIDVGDVQHPMTGESWSALHTSAGDDEPAAVSDRMPMTFAEFSVRWMRAGPSHPMRPRVRYVRCCDGVTLFRAAAPQEGTSSSVEECHARFWAMNCFVQGHRAAGEWGRLSQWGVYIPLRARLPPRVWSAICHGPLDPCALSGTAGMGVERIDFREFASLSPQRIEHTCTHMGVIVHRRPTGGVAITSHTAHAWQPRGASARKAGAFDWRKGIANALEQWRGTSQHAARSLASSPTWRIVPESRAVYPIDLDPFECNGWLCVRACGHVCPVVTADRTGTEALARLHLDFPDARYALILSVERGYPAPAPLAMSSATAPVAVSSAASSAASAIAPATADPAASSAASAIAPATADPTASSAAAFAAPSAAPAAAPAAAAFAASAAPAAAASAAASDVPDIDAEASHISGASNAGADAGAWRLFAAGETRRCGAAQTGPDGVQWFLAEAVSRACPLDVRMVSSPLESREAACLLAESVRGALPLLLVAVRHISVLRIA